MYILPGDIQPREGKEWLWRMRNGEEFVRMERERVDGFVAEIAERKRKRDEESEEVGIGEIVRSGMVKKFKRILLTTRSAAEKPKSKSRKKRRFGFALNTEGTDEKADLVELTDRINWRTTVWKNVKNVRYEERLVAMKDDDPADQELNFSYRGWLKCGSE